MLGLAGLGGTWAVAWGNRRLARPTRIAMLDARTQFQVRLDALRARTAILARRRDLPPQARLLVDDVVMAHVLIDSTLARAASAGEVTSLIPDVERCLGKLDAAAAAVDLAMPADRPFDGLCANDPQHGAAAVVLDERHVCTACGEAADAGTPHRVRLVARGGQPIPFHQM